MSDPAAKQDTESPISSGQKKTSLDDLSRDDLLKKCRSLLTISQKAKQAKDDAVEEVKSTKHELNIAIQESSALQAEVEKLKQRVRTIADEKESVLTAIENVKSNNQELQNLVRSISAERDAFFRDITELNGEKKKLIAVVDMMGVENYGTLAEVRSLKDDKRKLNDELFAAISERETFETEIKEVKLKMVYLLNNSFSLLKKFDIEIVETEDSTVESGKTYTGIVCDLLSKLDKNIASIDSYNVENLYHKTADQENNKTLAKSQSNLNSEIEIQKDRILALESNVKSLECVNASLQEDIKSLKSLSNELVANQETDKMHLEELMNLLEVSRNDCTKAKRELDHLRDEIGELMEKNKKQTFNAMEMKGVKKENEIMKIAISEKEMEIVSLRDEFESNHKKLSLHIEGLQVTHQKELDSVQQELSNVKDKFSKSNIDSITTAESCNKIGTILSELRSELSNTREFFKQKEVEVMQLKQQINDLQISATDSQNIVAILEGLLRDKEQELSDIKDKCSQSVEIEHKKLQAELIDAKLNTERKVSQMELVIDGQLKAIEEIKVQLDCKEEKLKIALDQKQEQEYGKMEMLTALTKLDEELQVKVSDIEEIKSAHFKEIEELRNSISQLAENKMKLSNTLKKLEEEGNSELLAEVGKLEEELKSKVSEIESMQSVHKKELVDLQSLNHLLQEKNIELANATKKQEDSNMDLSAALQKVENELRNKESEFEGILSARKTELVALQSSIHQLEEKNLELANNLKISEADSKSESIKAFTHLQEELNIKNLELNKITLAHNTEVQDFQNLICNLEKHRLELSNNVKKLEDLLETKQDELDEILASGEKESREMSANFSELQRINAIQANEIATLTSDVQQSRANIKAMERDFSDQLRLADERDREKQERLSDDLVNFQNTSSETMATLNAVRTELEALKASQASVVKNGNQELLAEMNDMNQALKQRGETISKQRELIKELETRLKDSEKREAIALHDLEGKTAEIDAKEKELNDLRLLLTKEQETVSELQEETGKLRSRIVLLEREVREHGDTASEAMSCSTISRAEESTRLVDMEDSFEDRYTKLRVVAVRLKKKSSELAQQVASLEAERNKLASDAHNKASQLSSQAKHLQSIQQEYDKAQDLHDIRTGELKASLKLSEELSNDVASLKICVEQLKLEKEELVKDLDHCTTSKLALESQVQSLQTQTQSWRKEKGDWETQVRRLKEEARSAEQRADDEKARHARTSEELAAKKQQAKLDSVRCLEMADYERSSGELSQALSAERAKVAELHDHADAQREIHGGLLEQIRLMAESLEAEGSRCTESSQQLTVLRSRLEETSAALSDRDAEIATLRATVESQRADAEREQVEAARTAALQHERDAGLRDRAARLTQQVRHLEDQLSEKSSELAEVSRQLQTMTADFEGYKVRAQSVLRAKHRPEEASDCEEVAQLRRAADSSRARLNEISGQLESATAEVSSLQTDRERLLANARETAEALAAAEARCRALSERARDVASEHREALNTQKIHADILAQGYRTQLDDVRERAAAEKALLEDQILLLESRLLAEKNKIGRGEERSRGGRDEKSSSLGGSSVRRASPDHLMQLVREEGEGSESVDSLSPHLSSSDRHELMPLEKLLAGDNDHEPSGDRASPNTELCRLRRESALSDRRSRHLTAVLAEAERDRDRLEQLNAVLKEEIRRSQRSDEREQHAHNQEYLKNILLKFVTLQGGDERSRLVPVLNTILKLSPEEASHLTAVAKGDQGGSARGWGSFLWQ